MYMMFLGRGMAKAEMAHMFFGDTTDAAVKQVNSIIRTWASAMYEILQAEDWWLRPEDNKNVQSSAFSHADAEDVLSLADCTNVNCEGSNKLELIRQMLFSKYYGGTCGKYCVACSKIGGCTMCSPGQGGPAGDHQCMEAGGLFDAKRWAVPEGEEWPKLLYDAGVSTRTKTVARSAKCDLVTSGVCRKSKNSTLSGVQRSENFGTSSLRIRVENFIGIVKRRFRVLGLTFPINDIGMMDKIVFTCFMLHNFGPAIIR